MSRQNATYLAFFRLTRVHDIHAASLGREKALRLLASWIQPKRDRDQNERLEANILDNDIGVHRYPIMARLLTIHF